MLLLSYQQPDPDDVVVVLTAEYEVPPVVEDEYVAEVVVRELCTILVGILMLAFFPLRFTLFAPTEVYLSFRAFERGKSEDPSRPSFWGVPDSFFLRSLLGGFWCGENGEGTR